MSGEWSIRDDELLRDLWKHGVHYLSGACDGVDTEGNHPVPELIHRLVAHHHPRVRHALIAMFLLHPEFSTHLPESMETMSEEERDSLKILYTAAVYLQRLWWTRLRRHLGDVPQLPDLYSRSLKLPAAEERHGKVGLHRLAERQAERAAYPLNYLASYEKVADNLFGQLEAERRAA